LGRDAAGRGVALGAHSKNPTRKQSGRIVFYKEVLKGEEKRPASYRVKGRPGKAAQGTRICPSVQTTHPKIGWGGKKTLSTSSFLGGSSGGGGGWKTEEEKKKRGIQALRSEERKKLEKLKMTPKEEKKGAWLF